MLRFDGQGLSVTLDMARNAKSDALLARLDDLTMQTGAIPNIIKDSRLPGRVARACYLQYDEFRERLRAYDPARLFRSELSERLGL